ncbi:MAG: hypothetical protein IJJ01_11680 [Firmicutes bacterium]|nr:hypothetical protein [Bacillota bacterium]
MLNETLEAGEYLYDFRNDKNRLGRIKSVVLLKKDDQKRHQFLGLERILTVIARYFIYEDDVEYEEGIRRADAALRMWCGHAPENKADDILSDQYEYLQDNYPWIEWWLPEYLRETVSKDNEDEMENVEQAIIALKNKKMSYSVSSLNKQAKDNDFKTIRYDKIIANAAVSRGPLKKYYLACNDAEWERHFRRAKNMKPTKLQHDRALKTMAAYMLERSQKMRKDPAPRFELINYLDITHWAEGGNTVMDKGKYKDLVVSDRPLFVFQSGVSGNTAKIKPDPEWFKACDWQLIDATIDDSALDEFLDNNPDGIFYSDDGGGKPLAVNVRYIR